MSIPTVVIEPSRGLFDLDLGSLWEYRELLYFLAWRNAKVRYKETVGWGRLGHPSTAAYDDDFHGDS